MADIPTRTGLGSSSSFTVGLLNALCVYLGKKVSREQLAQDAINIERNLIKERVGCQDQYHAAFGGFNYMVFNREGIQIIPLQIEHEKLAELESSVMLLYTGITRYSHEVLKEQIDKTKTRHNDRHLAKLYGLVEEGRNVLLSGGDVVALGKLLHEGWLIKRELSSAVTNSIIDQAYEAARSAGAVGGKLSGAGSGGFLLLIVPREHQDRVRMALRGLKEMPFRFETSGSDVIYSQPEE
jgi:D-glycero-alpha-D-manno-heptose-7-phosphate kinase